MPYDADIGIVGGGPAGARAAELLAGLGGSVLLWDPRSPWEKPCGGGLTAAALRDVPELAEMLSRARETRRIRLDSAAGAEPVMLPLAEPIYLVSRRELAAWQLERASRAGAVHVPAAVRGVGRDSGGGWSVTLDDGAAAHVRLLVGADGAASTVRRATSPGLPVERLPTRMAWPVLPGDTDTLAVRFGDPRPGYLWDFPRSDHRSVGIMALRDAGWNRTSMDEAVEAYTAELDGAPSRDSGRGRGPCGGAVIGTAMRRRARGYTDTGGADFALLGDAAGLADPATGEGIRNALRSAGLLARAYAEGGDFSRYPALAEAAFEPEFRAARRARRLIYRPRLVSGVIRLAARSGLVRAFLAGCFDMANESDFRLVRRWRQARARIASEDTRE